MQLIKGLKGNKIELREQPSGENAMLVLPPQVKVEYYEVRISFFSGEDLPKMDSNYFNSSASECNAYLKLKYMGIDLKTSVKDMKDKLVLWNESLIVSA